MKFENYFHPVSSHLLLFFNLIPRSHIIYILVVIIMIILEIKMKSWALLSSNLPSVIDGSNLSLSREAAS